MSSGDTTVDHEVIRKWTEQRGGRPTRVKGTEGRDGAGILRIDFNEPEDSLEEISWDEFFETFDDRELAFLYQDKTADGHTSRFFKFVHRAEDASPQAASSAGATKGKSQAGGPRRASAGKAGEQDRTPEESQEPARNKSTAPTSAAGARRDTQEAGGKGEAGGSDELKSREYRDEKGEVHHHTRSYMEQHKK